MRRVLTAVQGRTDTVLAAWLLPEPSNAHDRNAVVVWVLGGTVGYLPKYGFESSAQYTSRLKGTRDEQQALIKQDTAAPCDTQWTVGGSATEGKKMVKQQAKLMLRAFNGECDAAIAKVRYDNVTTLEKRLTKAYDDINKLGEVQRVFISRRYFDLKLAELHLVHEHREKVEQEQEKEEQKRIREQMREEQRVQDEVDRAKAEAEKEEARSAAAAEETARLRAAGMEAAEAAARTADLAHAATAKQHEKLESLVNRLETDLKDAIDRKAKAIARAQLTRSGHVYVLSNIGSFGESVFKIGMTRRLDPLERVDELGDASVPFPFDVHAIIYSDPPFAHSCGDRGFATPLPPAPPPDFRGEGSRRRFDGNAPPFPRKSGERGLGG